MTPPENLHAAIEQAIQEVLSSSGRGAKSLSPSDALMGDIGLDSLDLAQVVVVLEQRLGVDPFRTGGQSVRTLEDLHQVYRTAIDAAA